jgi:hypothetical protein
VYHTSGIGWFLMQIISRMMLPKSYELLAWAASFCCYLDCLTIAALNDPPANLAGEPKIEHHTDFSNAHHPDDGKQIPSIKVIDE